MKISPQLIALYIIISLVIIQLVYFYLTNTSFPIGNTIIGSILTVAIVLIILYIVGIIINK
jgi:uncharacterized BrkB/YihY/UPF0761 family membrane protein